MYFMIERSNCQAKNSTNCDFVLLVIMFRCTTSDFLLVSGMLYFGCGILLSCPVPAIPITSIMLTKASPVVKLFLKPIMNKVLGILRVNYVTFHEIV